MSIEPKRLGLIDWLAAVRGRVRFRDGAISEVTGWVPAGFLNGCRDVARLHRIRRGTVRIVGRGRDSHLRFSRDFPDSARQAIANIWTPPSGDGGGGTRAAG